MNKDENAEKDTADTSIPTQTTLKQTIIAGKSVGQWDGEWQRLKGGFAVKHREVHGYVGVFRAVQGADVMYIGCSSAAKGGKLYQRLLNFKNQEQQSNSHYGARKIREHIGTLSLDVICLGRTSKDRFSARELKRLMIELHQPAWNVRKPDGRKK